MITTKRAILILLLCLTIFGIAYVIVNMLKEKI